MVAGLRFTFDGERRSGPNCGEKGRTPFYKNSRHMQYQPYGRYNPFFGPVYFPGDNPGDNEKHDDIGESRKQASVGRETEPFMIHNASYDIQEESVQGESRQEQANTDITKDKEASQQQQTQSTEKEEKTVNVSEKFVSTMEVAETGLNNLRVQVDVAKNLFDDFIYKLESAVQILEIIKSNEERRINGPQVQVASWKTTKDTVDEVLELLQTPVFQNILRQFMIGWIAQKQKQH